MAEVIKKSDANTVYTITGYADKGTGSKKINERLSKERAQAVYDCLVKESACPSRNSVSTTKAVWTTCSMMTRV